MNEDRPLQIVPQPEIENPNVSNATLRRVAHAEENRAERAVEAMQTGTMTVELLTVGEIITAKIQSTTVIGKRNPKSSTKEYAVVVGPGGADCSCPDHQYRGNAEGALCKHIVAATIAAQELGTGNTERDEKQQNDGKDGISRQSRLDSHSDLWNSPTHEIEETRQSSDDPTSNDLSFH